MMMSIRFLVIFAVSFAGYFILDYVLSNVMLYLVGGIVGGSINKVFEVIGIKAGNPLIGLVWGVMLIGIILLFYRSRSYVLKCLLVVLIAILLYVVDLFVLDILYSYVPDTLNLSMDDSILGVFFVFFKSMILSLMIYTGISRSR